jgi:protein-S-isoprenylcysteine O-methyltransferase Ste14
MTAWQLNIIPWDVLLVYFGISALRVKQTRVSEPFAKRIQHVGPLIIAAFLLFARSLRFGPLGARFVPESDVIQYCGVGLTCLGVAITIWARYCLGEYWSSRVTLKVGHQIIRSGPYAYVRHPLYTGILTALTGTALVVGQWRGVLAVLLALAAFWRKASSEEALLSTEFGDRYAEYREQTGFLTPRLR